MARYCNEDFENRRLRQSKRYIAENTYIFFNGAKAERREANDFYLHRIMDRRYTAGCVLAPGNAAIFDKIKWIFYASKGNGLYGNTT